MPAVCYGVHGISDTYNISPWIDSFFCCLMSNVCIKATFFILAVLVVFKALKIVLLSRFCDFGCNVPAAWAILKVQISHFQYRWSSGWRSLLPMFDTRASLLILQIIWAAFSYVPSVFLSSSYIDNILWLWMASCNFYHSCVRVVASIYWLLDEFNNFNQLQNHIFFY